MVYRSIPLRAKPVTLSSASLCVTFRRVIRRVVACYGVLALLLLSLVGLTSCDMDDSRDLCCKRVDLIYRYVPSPAQGDQYQQEIRGGMRHFLYSGDSIYLREVYAQRNNPQYVRLSNLIPGAYMMLTVANSSPAGTLLEHFEPGATLGEAQLRLAKALEHTAGLYQNSEELFYNLRAFRTNGDAPIRYYCDLSNVHCHLQVQVEWEDTPKHLSGAYELRASRIAAAYDLGRWYGDPIVIARGNRHTPTESTLTDVVHHFPTERGEMITHHQVRQLFDMKLYYDLISLRYRDDAIPVLRLYYQGEPVTTEIDLSKAFKEWRWHPDLIPAQLFRIKILIHPDGSVTVSQWVSANVLDWVDGGTLGVGD